LNALCHDDYVASLDNLHRYFDYRSVALSLLYDGLCLVFNHLLSKYIAVLNI